MRSWVFMMSAITLCAAIYFVDAQQPLPVPTPPNTVGNQYPYVTTVTIQTTQIVTTVFSIKFLRIVDSGEVNLIPLRTNYSSSHITNLPYAAP